MGPEDLLRCHINQPLNHITCQPNRIHTPRTYFINIHSNIILPPRPSSCEWSFPFGLPTNILNKFLISPMHATCPTHLNLLDLLNLAIYGEAYRVMKSLTVQHFPVFQHFLPLTSIYSPQHPVLEHPHFVFS